MCLGFELDHGKQPSILPGSYEDYPVDKGGATSTANITHHHQRHLTVQKRKTMTMPKTTPNNNPPRYSPTPPPEQPEKLSSTTSPGSPPKPTSSRTARSAVKSLRKSTTALLSSLQAPLSPAQKAEFDAFLSDMNNELQSRIGVIAAREEAERAAIKALEREIEADARYRASVAVFAKTGSRNWFKRRSAKKRILGRIYCGTPGGNGGDDEGDGERKGVDPRVLEIKGRRVMLGELKRERREVGEGVLRRVDGRIRGMHLGETGGEGGR
ncbi:hypothetical protein B0T21DRAFT_417116 [Apiosordaria backusii]|uniref:Uncharacterized protein n=1 Tax=Apiosordaria backusii TaxID=314023 RepID=A0AA39ZPQ2_9PEZI|nr:hypothetical protein B0T21DRAFT_417116 [Apiosordaria backusii]